MVHSRARDNAAFVSDEVTESTTDSTSPNTLALPFSGGPLDRSKSASDPALNRTECGDLTPKSERRLQSILKQSKFKAMQEILTTATSPGRHQLRRNSSIAMEMLLEVQDRDMHPFGRGGVYEGVFNDENEDMDLNTNKVLAWLILIGCLSFMAVGIIVLAELERLNYNTTGNLTKPKSILAVFGLE